jgi:hypothetical protein
MRIPGMLIALGGVLMTLLFIPFTLAHGPTSINEEHVILGLDMHGWGFAMGVVPNVLIAAGLWLCRDWLAQERRAARIALTVICVALLASAAMDLAFRALGPPLSLFILAPATTVAALTLPPSITARVLMAGLSLCLWGGLVLSLIPLEIQDGFNGYRITGTVMYGAVGLLWAALGLTVALSRRDFAQVAH